MKDLFEMSNLLLDRQCAYLPIPRTGEEEISLALLGFGFSEFVPDDGNLSGLTTFTVVRNPFELVRIWFDLNPGWDDFAEFIKNYNHSHFAPGGKLFWSFGEDTIRYENLDKGCLQEYLEQFDLVGELVLPDFKITDYREHYEPETIELVRARFGDEIEVLEYEF